MQRFSQAVGGSIGTTQAEEPTLQEAKNALDNALEDVRDTYRALTDNGGNAEVVAFRSHVLTENISTLMMAAYTYQRAAYNEAKPKK